MWELFQEFISFSHPNVRYVTLGSVLLGASSATVGCFTFLRKRALVGDAVAHSVLPGVCLAFILAGGKNPLFILIGAFISGWISLFGIDFIVAKTRIKEDTAIGLVLSVFFGLGILLLTSIQKSGNSAQAGLDKFLFGKAASLIGADLIIFSVVAILLVAFVLIFFKEFMLISFDEDFARSIGFPVKMIEMILTSLTVMAVVIGIQAVGVVLMAAMLITPAVAARYWTENLRWMVFLAACLGAFSGFFGAFISFSHPSMPTGPWIVLIVSVIAFISLMISPKRGALSRIIRQYKIRKQILEENILKLFYHLGEASGNPFKLRNLDSMQEKRPMSSNRLRSGLNSLKRQGYLESVGKNWRLTEQGMKKGGRITRLHRLWELYLTTHLRIAPDHVHEDAETIEHVLTPEIEEQLEKILNFPKIDPHQREIPKAQ